jgi:hypothetical protein
MSDILPLGKVEPNMKKTNGRTLWKSYGISLFYVVFLRFNGRSALTVAPL